MESILEDIKTKQDEYDEYIKYKKVYNKFRKTRNMKLLNDDELILLEEYEFMPPDDIKPKVNFIIFDDLIGSGLFNKKAKSLVNNLVIKHRHLKTNLIFTTQSFKAIPPIIRTNIDIYAVFKSSSYNEILNKIYDDISGFIKKDDFIEAYEYATKDKHDALIIINNSMGNSGTRIFKNWNKELIISH
jgi:hypothetical protein